MSEEKKDKEQSKTGAVSVVWDDSKMQTTYANVVNASSTREEVSIFFGTNQSWNPVSEKELRVHLTDRMVLNPYAAKRLTILLAGIVKEYENRFGELPLEAAAPDKTH
ncbi:MAG: DUF3467 domain-containing protein [Methylobacter sp.]